MLKVGDIVKVKLGFKGSNAIYIIVEDTKKSARERFRIKLLGFIKKEDEDSNIQAKEGENFIWSESELDLIRTVESIESEAHTISIDYGPIEKRTNEVIRNTISNYKHNIEDTRWLERYNNCTGETKIELAKIDPIASISVPIDLICKQDTIKEEKDMNKENEIDRILNIYFDKKEKEIKKEAKKEMNKVLEKDPIQQLIKEMNSQLKIIVENAGEDFDTYLEIEYNKVLAVTDKEKFEVNETYYKKQDELKDKHTEVRALVMLADTYEERIKVLKNNGILDNKGNFKD